MDWELQENAELVFGYIKLSSLKQTRSDSWGCSEASPGGQSPALCAGGPPGARGEVVPRAVDAVPAHRRCRTAPRCCDFPPVLSVIVQKASI